MINLYKYEIEMNIKGYKLVAGVDEAGRGPLAGPVVAAAVILGNEKIEGINDSKKLSAKKREALYPLIKEKAIAYSIIYIDNNEIDKINIYQASKKAMIMALEKLSVIPDFALIDAMPLDISIPTLSLIKGDTLSVSIGAASILAKVSRDNYMIKMDEKYPEYGFKQHKGYPTKMHIEAIKKHGLTSIHRLSYKPNKEVAQMRLDI